MLMCGPNAEVIEFLQFNQEMNWYLSKGMNFCAFNYRGFSLSNGGNPSLKQIKRDGEDVVEYLRKHKITPDSLLGVHGRSIGGSVAVHLAR